MLIEEEEEEKISNVLLKKLKKTGNRSNFFNSNCESRKYGRFLI